MATSEKKRAYQKKWHEEHREHLKEYREKTKEKRNARRRESYRQDEWRRKSAVEATRQYRKKQPLARQASTYKIDRRDLELMMNEGCAICGANPLVDPHAKLHVDHNHRTGKVRGVLCKDCNLALGCFNDDPILLGSAINYLLKEYEVHE